jgi:PAS domain S-box-containing protein
MIWMTGPAGQFTYLNQQWFEFTGQSFGKMETRGWSQTIHPDDISRFMEVYISAVKKLEEFRVDFRLVTATGDHKWVMAHGVPHFAENGAFEGYIGSAIDIDNRKQDEVRNEFLLKFMSALSRALTPKEVADVIIGQGLLALDGHVGIVALVDKEEKYLNMVNRRGVPEELIELFKVLPIEANAPLCDCVRTGQPVWIERLDDYAKRYPTWASEVLPLTHTQASACLPLKIGRDVIGAIQISFARPMEFTPDVRRFILTTAFQCAQAMERARLYEAEAAARKLAETANELKLRFLGMVSHELRAPLHLIMGFSDMLITPGMDWEPEKLDEIFGILNQESHKLHELVEQLLDASQVQAGTLGIKMQEYPLSGVVEMARSQMEKFAEKHELVINVPDDLPIVKVDPARIGQVIVNLVGNAAKYSPAGTTITVNAYQIGDMVQVDVSDEGEGIPPEHRESIFEAFQRIDRDREKRIKGVGLGLAIVKGVIDAHEGRIWVQDRPAPGTTMSFTVQIADGE